MEVTNLRTAAGGSLLMAGSALPVGTKSPIKIDISSTDHTLTVPIRMLTAITGTVIMVDMETMDGVITDVPCNPGLPVFNVTKIKKVGTDATQILAWPLE